MSVDNGSSVLKSSSTQDEVRRAQKARQKRNARKSTNKVSETFSAGYEVDRRKKRGAEMLDILEATMVSSGASSTALLQKITATYIAEFSFDTTRKSSTSRHESALNKALKGIDKNLAGFARRQLYSAFYKTC